MVTIHLHNVIFFAHHGIYDEEREKGNTFEVNLDVMYNDEEAIFEHIEQTIDYAALYLILTEQMQIATPLLEKVCTRIIERIRNRFPFSKEISINIYKLAAPIEGFTGRAGVTIRKTFYE